MPLRPEAGPDRGQPMPPAREPDHFFASLYSARPVATMSYHSPDSRISSRPLFSMAMISAAFGFDLDARKWCVLNVASAGFSSTLSVAPSSSKFAVEVSISIDGATAGPMPLPELARRHQADCSAWVDAVARLLKPTGRLYVLVGDSVVNYQPLRGDTPIREAAERSGLRFLARAAAERPNFFRYRQNDAPPPPRLEHLLEFQRPS